jgi:transposase
MGFQLKHIENRLNKARACHQLADKLRENKRISQAMTTKRYALRNDQWERIEGLLPGRSDTVGVTAKDNRLFVEAVLYRYRSGCAWRDIPERFGDFRVVHLRHSRWSKSGVWQRVFEALAGDADNEYAMMDATIVRAHQHSAGAKGGRQRPKRLAEVAVGSAPKFMR